ncbi:MAG: hypothetical protein EOO56_23860 [Hymenobacter sp.]|nr:MAG: hypothetical protein EOO56_23860 [Hymenobacter sp.]
MRPKNRSWLVEPLGWPMKEKNAMYVVRHYDKRPSLYERKMLRNLLPAFNGSFSQHISQQISIFYCRNSGLNLTEVGITILGAESDKVLPSLPVVLTRPPRRINTVFIKK